MLNKYKFFLIKYDIIENLFNFTFLIVLNKFFDNNFLEESVNDYEQTITY